MIKEIEGYSGYYVSDDGKIFCNLGKGNRRDKGIIKTVPLYEIKPRPTQKGYLRVCLRNDLTNKRADLYVHRIVAKYFIPNNDNKKYVDHINCDRQDNRVENLRWVTAKENTDHTQEVQHILRDKLGRYKSNFTYKF